MTDHRFWTLENTLGPDDLRMAADAFEAALRAVDERICLHNPYAARRIIGRYIIERALAGERDPVKLRKARSRAWSYWERLGLRTWQSPRSPRTEIPNSPWEPTLVC